MDISEIVNKLLTDGINKKNYIIVVPMVIGAIFYVLGIDMNMIMSFAYTNTFLLIGLFIYEFITGCLFLSKMDELLGNRNSNVSDIVNKLSDDESIIKDKVEKIESTLIEHDKRFISTAADIRSKPNIGLTKMIINSDVKNIFNDIFEECLNYTLIANEENHLIALENLKTNSYAIIKEQINYIHDLLKSFETNEDLSNTLKDKIYNMVDVICVDIQKSKKINEKLYTINCILRETRKELKKIISDYIREIQIELFD